MLRPWFPRTQSISLPCSLHAVRAIAASRGSLYVGSGWQADCDAIFRAALDCRGVTCDVARSGRCHAVDIGPVSIVILARWTTTCWRAFPQRVRASRCAVWLATGRSVVGKARCPYHQWTYDSWTGRCAGTALMGIDFDRVPPSPQARPLCAILGGLLYACLSVIPPKISRSWAAVPVEPRSGQPMIFANAKVAFEQRPQSRSGNWKLTMENNPRMLPLRVEPSPGSSCPFHAAGFRL